MKRKIELVCWILFTLCSGICFFINFMSKPPVDDTHKLILYMIGAATVLSMTGEHPAMKVDQMTSPEGTTIEVLKVLQQEGFANAIMTSVDTCVSKANSLKQLFSINNTS